MLIRNNKLLKHDKFKLEKDLQTFVENHIPDILGEEYEFVCTEFSVGDFRIDSLAFNKETKSFIIIEDKKIESSGLIDQGLSYLKLLKERKNDFIMQYYKVKGILYTVDDIDMSQSRVVFFSPHYNKYQLYALDYQNIPFDLYKVTKYEEDIVFIDKIEKKSKQKLDNNLFGEIVSEESNVEDIKVYTEDDHLNDASEKIKELYEQLRDRILELGDIDIDVKKVYISFKGLKNIVCVEVFKSVIRVIINMKKNTVYDSLNVLNCYITGDGRSIGHHGTGDYYYDVNNIEDIDKLIPFIKQSLEVNKK